MLHGRFRILCQYSGRLILNQISRKIGHHSRHRFRAHRLIFDIIGFFVAYSLTSRKSSPYFCVVLITVDETIFASPREISLLAYIQLITMRYILHYITIPPDPPSWGQSSLPSTASTRTVLVGGGEMAPARGTRSPCGWQQPSPRYPPLPDSGTRRLLGSEGRPRSPQALFSVRAGT